MSYVVATVPLGHPYDGHEKHTSFSVGCGNVSVGHARHALPLARRTPAASSSTTISVVGLAHSQSSWSAFKVAPVVASHAIHIVRSQLATLLSVAQLMQTAYGELGSVSAGSTEVRLVFPTHSHPRPSAVTASPLGQLSHVSVCARKYVPLSEQTFGGYETPNALQSPSTWWGSGCQRRKRRL